MSQLTLGHRLARELARRGSRGNWRRFFAIAHYRELRRIDSVEELAEFLDRTGYRTVRASEDVEEVANDIEVQRDTSGTLAPIAVGIFTPVVGLLLVPVMLLWRALWREDR